MIISKDVEKTFDKIATTVLDKNSQQTKDRRERLQPEKGYVCVYTHTYIWKKANIMLKTLSLRLGSKQ